MLWATESGYYLIICFETGWGLFREEKVFSENPETHATVTLLKSFY